jgi:hypothetical protein
MESELTLEYFWRAGGFGMYQVSAFGLLLLWAAGRFAYRPDEQRLPYLRCLVAATLASIALAVVADVSAVCWAMARMQVEAAQWRSLLLVGLFESLTPAALGFGLLSLALVCQALGLRQLASARTQA